MSIKLPLVELSELELEDLIVQEPSVIEDGFKVVAHQWPTDSGPLDILGVDAEGTVAVVELKVKEDDGQIIQALRYYDYISDNLVAIAHYFSSDEFHVSDQEEPRLILVAPSFSRTLRRICKYLDVEIDLKEYRAYRLPSGEIALAITTIEIEDEKTKLRIYPTLEQKLERIQNEKMRELAKRFLEELERMGYEKKMVKDEWISLWYKGRRIAYLGCKRKFFVIETSTHEGWKRFRIESEEDYTKKLDLLKSKIQSETE